MAVVHAPGKVRTPLQRLIDGLTVDSGEDVGLLPDGSGEGASASTGRAETARLHSRTDLAYITVPVKLREPVSLFDFR